MDDHRLVRAGLRAIIDATEDLQVVGEAADGQEAADVVALLAPDVVLMDLSMPGVDGVEGTRRLHAAGTPVAVVVLTSFAERDRVLAALEAGAIGYLLKDSEPTDVLAAVRSAAAGHVPIDPRVAGSLLPTAATAAPEAAGAEGRRTVSGLSDREREVLGQVARGLANKQVARALGISERTVKVHLGNVFRRIGVADRTSAALWARDHGLG